MTAFQIAEGIQSNTGLNRDWEIVPYRVEGLVAAGKPRDSEFAVGLAGPALGTNYQPPPNPRGLILLDKRIIEFVGNDKAHVAVIYGRPGGFGTAPRSGTNSRTDSKEHLLPIFVFRPIIQGGQSFINYQRMPSPIIRRNETLRAEYRILSQSQKDDVISESAEFGGAVITLGGLTYQYNGASLQELNTGQLQVAFWFRSRSAIPGFSVGSWGNDVAIPALPILAEYKIDTTLTTVNIGIKTPGQTYGTIGTLTGLGP